jgi:hypothetical protein
MMWWSFIFRRVVDIRVSSERTGENPENDPFGVDLYTSCTQ